MRSRLLTAVMLTAAAMLALNAVSPARADTILLADLQNANENPPVVPTTTLGDPRPASFGDGLFVLNDAMTAMTMTGNVYNLDFTGTQTPDPNDDVLAAHIHGPAAPNQNGPVIWGFFGAPFNETSPNDLVLTPFLNGVGATITGKWDAPEGNNTALAAQVPNILAGLTYINFHTTQFRGGEIRGQLTVVPEPGAVSAAFAMGLSGLAVLRRLKRK